MRVTRGGPGGEGVDGPVAVETPDDVEVRILPAARAGSDRRDRGSLRDDETDPLLTALTALESAEDTRVVADIRLSVPPERRFRSQASDPVRLRVAVAETESAVVLMQAEGGVYTWVYPESDTPVPSRRSAPGGRDLTFTLASADEAGSRPTRGLPGMGEVGGWLVDKLTRPVRAIVLTFAADVAIKVLIDKIEGGNACGLVLVRGWDPTTWTAPAPATRLPAEVRDGARRVLLLVHGTFSDTKGSFGQLTQHAAGQAFLQAAYIHYDAVIGFDHKTLAESVEENVALMADVLRELPAGAQIDAVAYSRGGLVFRVLAEEVLADRNWNRAVFVGCTNGGTHLASPDNWRALADVYTNVVMAGAKFTTGLLGGAAFAPFIDMGIKTLGEFVKILPHRAVKDGRVPGLASMDPDGKSVARLNGADAPGPACDYYAISSDFEPGLDFSRGIGPALGRALLDKVTDDLWQKAPNDLVVDTASMSDVGGIRTFQEVSAYPKGGDCYHTIYFSLPKTAEHLRVWLLKNADDSDDDLGWDDGGRSLRKMESGAEGAERERIDVGIRGDGPIDDDGEAVALHAAASLPESPAAGAWVDLRVTLSRDEITTLIGRIQASRRFDALAAQPLRIVVRPVENCTIDETAEVLVDVPEAGVEIVRTFRIKGLTPGSAEVRVEIGQGSDTLQRLVLQPVFRETAAAISTASGAVEAGSKLLPMLDVRVWEESMAPKSWRLRFLVRSPELGIDIDAFTDLKIDRTDYVAGLYDRLEAAWRPKDASFAAAEAQIVNAGADLYRTLFPPAVQRVLWSERDKIGSIQVFSYAPTIPWEVCFLTEPATVGGDGLNPVGAPSPSRKKGGRFLAELGLTRWISNIGIAPASLALRPGRALYCVPDYADARLQLANVAAEIAMLETTLGAERLEPHFGPVMEALQGEGQAFDLLHFACHGEASADAIWNSGLLLQGEGTTANPRKEPLTLSDLRTASLATEGRRPIVFLNACQAAGDGMTLGGSSSLAQALVERGAGLLVGALWSIADDTAPVFAETFYAELKRGVTVTEAVAAAREKARAVEPKDFTWLAYAVFGHPYARVTS